MTKTLYALGVIFLLLGIGLFGNWARHTKIFADATTHQPERFTELYFANPNALPIVARARQLIPVKFVIHNLEAKDMQYTYRIDFLDSQGGTVELGQHQLSLAKGKIANVAATITLPALTGRGEVRVQLVNQLESIDFWTEVAS